jgi:uncharacterized membrane protein
MGGLIRGLGGGRYWEIDLLRGTAVVMMVLFHTLYAIDFFGIAPIPVHGGFWRLFAICTASTFVFLVGVSIAVRHGRHGDAEGYGSYLARGARIFALGLLVTGVTLVLLPGRAILFGILHLIGTSTALAPAFFRARPFLVILGVLIFMVGLVLPAFTGPLWLLPIGLHPADFASLDYEPLFPWFGLVLLGMSTGFALYPGGRRIYPLPERGPSAAAPIVLLGRNSLLVYLVHPLLIVLALYLVAPSEVGNFMLGPV